MTNKAVQEAFTKRKLLYEESEKVSLESDRLYEEGFKLYKQKGSSNFKAEGYKFYAEAKKLYSEAEQWRAQGDLILIKAVLQELGNVEMEWDLHGSVSIDGELYLF
ncbi:MAG: hypothetical protein KGJ07_06980 [Patescibacteria group bacterium]|nr:hypothetical protein [Patescibacteria group bacterium]